MEIIYDDYDWKLIGNPKTGISKQAVTFFPRIEGIVAKTIIEELEKYRVILDPKLKATGEYQNAKDELREKLRATQQQNLITITAISRLTKIAEKKLLGFLADDADFDTGELFALSVMLDQIQKECYSRISAKRET